MSLSERLRKGIWYCDLTGVVEKEKDFRIQVDKAGHWHLASEDGNTYGISEVFYRLVPDGCNELGVVGETKCADEAQRKLVKMYKCKLYLELTCLEDAGHLMASDRTLLTTLDNDSDIKDITGRS